MASIVVTMQGHDFSPTKESIPDNAVQCWYISQRGKVSTPNGRGPFLPCLSITLEYFHMVSSETGVIKGNLGRKRYGTKYFEEYDSNLTYFIDYIANEKLYFTFDKINLFSVAAILPAKPLLFILEPVISADKPEPEKTYLHNLPAKKANTKCTDNLKPAIPSTMPPIKSPRTFISYSYDSEEHKAWVLLLAEQLKKDGVDVILDRWHLEPGNDKFVFMEESVANSNYVLIICTKRYAEKANKRIGGAGYEATIITPELAGRTKNIKFVPLLRSGDWDTAFPVWAKSMLGIDMRVYPPDDSGYAELLRHVHSARLKPPPLGKPPEFPELLSSSSNLKNNSLLLRSPIVPILPDEVILNAASLKDEMALYPMSHLLGSFFLKRHEIEVHIKKKFELKCTSTEMKEFSSLNKERQLRGMNPQFPAMRYRLLGPPRQMPGRIVIDVAPFNYTTFAVLRESKNALLTDEIKTRLKTLLDHSHLIDGIEPRALVPIGVEILLITNDNKILLRQRGGSVQTEKNKWDVSISGYAGTSDLDPHFPNRIDLSRTANEELIEEIVPSNSSPLNANPADVEFLGLHVNRVTGATDVLACWRLDISSKELKNMLSHQPGNNTVFKTTRSSLEPFVRDTNNYLVDFTKEALVNAVKEIHASGERFMAEAFMVLVLAMERKL